MRKEKPEKNSQKPRLAGHQSAIADATISCLEKWAVSRPIIGGAKILEPLSVLFQEIFSKSRFVLSLATTLTHLYWLTVALFVCASMDIIFENVKYDYRLKKMRYCC